MTNDVRHIRVSKWLLVGLFAAAALALAAGGYWIFRREARSVRNEKYADMKAIAVMKAGQVAAWRNERLADARINSSGLIRTYILRWLKAPDDDSLKADIQARLKLFREAEGYQNMILTAPDGRLWLSLEPSFKVLEAVTKEQVTRAADSHEPLFGDLFRCPACGQVHLDVAAPILDEAQRPAAVLLLRSDPEKHLYPLIQSWPTPSRSAETLLVRRDGNTVVLLNKLRHQNTSPLSLRMPLTRSDSPAVRAALGRTGEFLGRDYRGVDVLADIRPVLGSTWFLVTKIDTSEILAEARYRGGMILLIVVLSILMTGVLAMLTYNYKHRRLAQNLYYSELEHRTILLANKKNLEHYARELEIRDRIVEVLLTVPDEEMYVRVLTVILEAMESKHAVFGYLDEDANLVVPTMTCTVWDKCRVPDKKFIFPRSTWTDSTWPRAIREKRTICMNESSTKIPEGHIPMRRHISMPLVHGGEAVGLIQVANKETDYSPEDVALLEMIGGAIAPVLDARLMRERLEAARKNAEELAEAALAESRRLLNEAERMRLALLSVVEDQKMTEDEIRELNAELEQRVHDRTSELEASNKELESFAYAASHDLRAPLRGIDGWSLALLEDYHDLIDERGRQFLDRIRSETQRMAQLIDDLLQFSRETRGEMNWQTVDMTAAAQAVASRLREEHPSLRCEFVIQPGLTARGDARLLDIALGNLLDNALKFSRHRSPAKIEFGQVEQNGKNVFFIRDNGVGFDMAYAHKLFKMFQRLHSSSDFPGTGVGLATVQRIINRHDGRVWVEAETDRGASFYFTLEEPK